MAALQVESVEGEEHACRESRGPGWGGQVARHKHLILVVSTWEGQLWLISGIASQPFTVFLESV